MKTAGGVHAAPDVQLGDAVRDLNVSEFPVGSPSLRSANLMAVGTNSPPHSTRVPAVVVAHDSSADAAARMSQMVTNPAPRNGPWSLWWPHGVEDACKRFVL